MLHKEVDIMVHIYLSKIVYTHHRFIQNTLIIFYKSKMIETFVEMLFKSFLYFN